ncbi:MAG: hypothetical protein IJW00_05730 [Clostridia bacterium]|nr:hypothetical protein [Clostridia bacterium]
MKYIYILISQTHTAFGGTIRRLGKINYNHAAIALDENMTELYAFARPKHEALLLGRLVKETMFRYSLGKHSCVNVMIFRIPVTEEQYAWVKDTIHRIMQSREYMYNLFSVLSTPITGGFSTYKAFSCIEFVMFLLQGLGYPIDKPLHRYRPDDLIPLLSDSVHYKGNLLDYKQEEEEDTSYFRHMSPDEILTSMIVPFRLFYRMLFKRRHVRNH